jgi:hypothetical protein
MRPANRIESSKDWEKWLQKLPAVFYYISLRIILTRRNTGPPASEVGFATTGGILLMGGNCDQIQQVEQV